jgi:hypothetical protein
LPKPKRRDAIREGRQVAHLLSLDRRRRTPFDQAARAAAAEEAHRLLQVAFAARQRYPHEPELWALWKTAADHFHAAVAEAYPPGFWEDVERLRARDPAALEPVVRFLEQDPYFFRAGYTKEELIHWIKRLDLPPAYVARLHGVILSVVERHNRREFGSYVSLARKLDSPELRAELAQRLEHEDAAVRRRVRWMLNALEKRR